MEKEIRLGEVMFRVDRRTAAAAPPTSIPPPGVRDSNIPGSLRANFGHKDLGVYLTVANGGTLAVNDPLTRPVSSEPQPSVVPKMNAGPGRRFMCRGCYFIYSEEAGLPAEGIAPGTSCQELPESWRCPDCGTDKSKLRPYVS